MTDRKMISVAPAIRNAISVSSRRSSRRMNTTLPAPSQAPPVRIAGGNAVFGSAQGGRIESGDLVDRLDDALADSRLHLLVHRHQNPLERESLCGRRHVDLGPAAFLHRFQVLCVLLGRDRV